MSYKIIHSFHELDYVLTLCTRYSLPTHVPMALAVLQHKVYGKPTLSGIFRDIKHFAWYTWFGICISQRLLAVLVKPSAEAIYLLCRLYSHTAIKIIQFWLTWIRLAISIIVTLIWFATVSYILLLYVAALVLIRFLNVFVAACKIPQTGQAYTSDTKKADYINCFEALPCFESPIRSYSSFDLSGQTTIVHPGVKPSLEPNIEGFLCHHKSSTTGYQENCQLIDFKSNIGCQSHHLDEEVLLHQSSTSPKPTIKYSLPYTI